MKIPRWLALWGLPAVFGLLFVAWPYQHWEFGQRFSVLHGWAKWVSKYADWQFCLLVPLLVGWLVWLRREELRKLPELRNVASDQGAAGRKLTVVIDRDTASRLLGAALLCLAAERAYHETEGRPWAERIAARKVADEARATLARMMGGE